MGSGSGKNKRISRTIDTDLSSAEQDIHSMITEYLKEASEFEWLYFDPGVPASSFADDVISCLISADSFEDFLSIIDHDLMPAYVNNGIIDLGKYGNVHTSTILYADSASNVSKYNNYYQLRNSSTFTHNEPVIPDEKRYF